jgi:hypothetical protein
MVCEETPTAVFGSPASRFAGDAADTEADLQSATIVSKLFPAVIGLKKFPIPATVVLAAW